MPFTNPVISSISGRMARIAPFSTSAGSFDTAQNVNGNFTKNFISTVEDSTTISHVEITQLGRPSSGNDYYFFTVLGATGTRHKTHIDIDGPTNFDTMIALWQQDGPLIIVNNDSVIDPGSFTTLDSRRSNAILGAGNWVVGVTRFNSKSIFSSRGGISNTTLLAGDTYTLNISTNQIAAVPEPASLTMWALGAVGMACARHRRSVLVQRKSWKRVKRIAEK